MLPLLSPIIILLFGFCLLSLFEVLFGGFHCNLMSDLDKNQVIICLKVNLSCKFMKSSDWGFPHRFQGIICFVLFCLWAFPISVHKFSSNSQNPLKFFKFPYQRYGINLSSWGKKNLHLLVSMLTQQNILGIFLFYAFYLISN